MFARLRAWLGQTTGHGARGTGHGKAQLSEQAEIGSENAAFVVPCPVPRTPCPVPGTRAIGDQAEAEALAHLQSAGLKLIQRNFLARGGELDLLMLDGATLVFVEVRFRTGDGHGDGIDSVSTSKQRRLITAARQFLADHPKYARYTTRFDVIALGSGGLRWVKNVITIDKAAW